MYTNVHPNFSKSWAPVSFIRNSMTGPYGVSRPSGYEHRTQALMLLFSRVWVRIPVVTLVSLSKTLNYNCFSPTKSKWVPVRAEIIDVIGLAG